MRKMQTKLQLLAVSCLILLFIAAGFSGLSFSDTIKEEQIRPTYGSIFYADKQLPLRSSLILVEGRLFLPLKDVFSAPSSDFSENDDEFILIWNKNIYNIAKDDNDELYKPIFYFDENPYIYIYDLAKLLNLAVMFDSDKNNVYLYNRLAVSPPEENNNHDTLKKAYLRLEDVTADYGIGGNFNNEGLEKLRVISDYLFERGQAFDVAWIPLFTNPPAGIQNDLTDNFNFYNADFLYTLDYIVQQNGRIVIHGLTHQENDTISAIGTEFGPSSPFTLGEIEERMKRAKEIAETLSFSSNVFEFPHYSFTKKQLNIASRIFNTICLQYPYAKKYGKVERVNRLHGQTTFIPTPQGYLSSVDELQGVIGQIENADKNTFVGLFMHPFMDFKLISAVTDANGFRQFFYDESGIIPSIVNEVSKKGYIFSKIE